MDMIIKYENGQMTIHMNAFFPTSQARLKKLLKVVDMDFEHREDHIKLMEQFFNDKVTELEEKKVSSGKKALEAKQKASDLSKVIESKKHPNGVRLTKDELEKVKEDYKHMNAVYAVYAGSLSTFNKSVRQKEQFLKHLEILQQRK